MQLKLAPWNWFKPSSKIFFMDRSKAVLLLWIICVIYVLCLSCFRVCSLLPCDHLLGMDWPLGSCLWRFCHFSLFVTFPCVRCSTWLHRFLIFATFLTFIVADYDISSPKITYTYYTFNFCFLFMKSSITARWWLVDDWKELVFL